MDTATSGAAEAVHPHACGEHASHERSHVNVPGSSPRMWGTRTRGMDPARRRRFIPTHVGNTINTRSNWTVASVHPHACGEHATSPSISPMVPGSSPRMWGTRPDDLAHRKPCRFIPTHVGNTRERGHGLRAWPVHPHACGEHTNPIQLKFRLN